LVVLIPDRVKGALEQLPKAWHSDWRLEAKFPHGEPARPQITIRGRIPKLPDKSINRTMGEAVALAAEFLSQKNILKWNIPSSVNISRVGQAYHVVFERIPAAPDAGVIVEVSLDLTRTRIFH
jgi:hypothetical protein